MRFLIDECLPKSLVDALEAEGHEARAVSVDEPGVADGIVVMLGWDEDRLVVSSDSDIPTKVVFELFPAEGVIFLKLKLQSRSRIIERVTSVVREYGESAIGQVLTVDDWRVRSRPLRDEPPDRREHATDAPTGRTDES